MPKKKIVIPLMLGVALNLSGCGTYVPEIQEFWGNADDAAEKVQMIATQVRCELHQAIFDISHSEATTIDNGGRGNTDWMRGWVADVLLQLQVEEKTALNPSVTQTFPFANAINRFPTGAVTTPQSYLLGVGATASSDATRLDKLHLFYELKDFMDKPPNPGSCSGGGKTANGDLFVRSNLKLEQWLTIAVNLKIIDPSQYVNDGPAGQSVISHDVKFEIISTGTVNPQWKLVPVSANTGSLSLFSTTRDRTQELIITLGPVKIEQSKLAGKVVTTRSLAPTAQNSAFASEISSGINNALRPNN